MILNFKKLPHKVQKKAIANTIEQQDISQIAHLFDKDERCVYGMFNFVASKEGCDYWYGIEEKYGEINNGLKVHKVQVTLTLSKTIEVTAKDQDDAESKANIMFEDGIITLSSEDQINVDINVINE
jgi:hypothetical protein